MVFQHQVPVLLHDGYYVCSFAHPQDQLGLTAVHDDVEAAGVLAVCDRADIVTPTDVAIYAESNYHTWVNGGVLCASTRARLDESFMYRLN